MGGVVSGLLPLAVVVAISPVPIVAVLLMLLAPKARGAGAGFLMGWIVGIAGVTTLVLLLAGGSPPGSRRSSSIASWVEVALGGLLVVLAARQWWSRPTHGEQPILPTWLAAIDRFTPVRAGALGLLLSTVNPKAVLVCVAAGLAIAGGALPGAQNMWSVAVFTGVAASTVAVPVLAYALGRARMEPRLQYLRRWLAAHGAAVTVTVLVVIGVILVGQGLGGLG